ncbi:TetR/AcrR family transcriptional regulator [Fimbriimonas ginsengisoli]|uniref:TetR family transcriptional regulator n=1 Tax=Fimbriimonas ginsengisoli Gsoil 348 TaxID=661478 RepID=A0A068NNZ6_FIMGI|nr:TetR/AcrR family transcriptional regulator [Fimbriimonas ginsengisoli]AIE85288.1 TetR family transcriptional regulator [Fimbriimonas ginsengisoli Gsoil 348]
MVANSFAKERRGDKRERTRARLIEVASEVVGEKGFDRTTLEEIAQRAGMTRGAIYGNFKNREEIFLAVAEAQWEPIVPQLVRGAPLRENMRRFAEAVIAAADRRRARAVGAASFQIYALTHPEMQARMAKGNAEIYRWAEEQLLQFVPASELPTSPSHFVKIVHALTEGILSIRSLTPELMTDETIMAAFEALA